MNTTSVTLSVDLTTEDKIAMGEELVRLDGENIELRAKKKSAMDHYQSLIDYNEELQKLRAAEWRSGKKDVRVECTIEMDYPAGVVNYRHPENGEIVKSRPMEEHERQDALPIDGGTPAAPGVEASA